MPAIMSEDHQLLSIHRKIPVRKLKKRIGYRPHSDVTIFHHPVAIFGGMFKREVNIIGNPLVIRFGTSVLQSDPDFIQGSRMAV